MEIVPEKLFSVATRARGTSGYSQAQLSNLAKFQNFCLKNPNPEKSSGTRLSRDLKCTKNPPQVVLGNWEMAGELKENRLHFVQF